MCCDSVMHASSSWVCLKPGAATNTVRTSWPQVRLWDLRANGCQALLQAPGLPTTAFDEQVGGRMCVWPPCQPSCPCCHSSLLPSCSIACQRLTTDASRDSCPPFLPQGLVFAVGAERGVVKLYDARNWAAGPFTSFPVGPAVLSVKYACECAAQPGCGV